VAAGVDFSQGVDVDVGVDLRGVDAFVAEHFLDVADVGPAAVHHRHRSACGLHVKSQIDTVRDSQIVIE
jgi:hypothetical protein